MVAAKRSFNFFIVFVLALTAVGCSFLDPRESYRYIEYPVQQGDSFYSIGSRFQVPAEELMDFNEVDDPEELRAGSYLKVPYFGQSLERTQQDLQPAKQNIGPAQPAISVKEGIPSNKKDKKTLNKIMLAGAGRYVGNLAWPTDGTKTKLTSKFDWRWVSFHEGIDLAGPKGTPIYAAHSGKVVVSGTKLRGYGNMVVIQSNGLMTVYGHNRRNRVRVGEFVEKGERIADLGDSGKTSGPHLHFETRIKNKKGKYAAVDPLIFY